MVEMSTAPNALSTCRYFVAPVGRAPFVAEVPEWATPALDALVDSSGPIKLTSAEVEELGRAGLPLKSSRRGTVLKAKVEAITLPPPEPCQPSRLSNYCGW